MGRPPGVKNKAKAVMIDPSPIKPKKAGPVKMEEPDYDRQAALEEESDMLHIPPEIIPDGMRYNWKTLSVLGMQQARRFGRYEATGWVAVPASRHPGLFTPKGYEGAIEYDGLVLMEKPEAMCRQTEGREFNKAHGQVQDMEKKRRGGDIGVKDAQHSSALRTNRVVKNYERIDIPKS